MKPLYAVIASGSAVSATVDARQINMLGAIHVPGMTSGDLTMQGALDSTSGSFARFSDSRAIGSADLRFATGPGSRFVISPFVGPLPPYIRMESLATQTDTRTITLLTR